jgi:3-hydroxyisobutyrate dehydrogenase-like beta-hydroxyacid dehydrogenase
MTHRTVGLLHPGEMGSAVAAAARTTGTYVIWASEGRSPATRNRAALSGLDDVGLIDRLVAESDFIISVCPPDSAVEVARSVAARRFPGVYVDANATSPPTTRTIATLIEGAEGIFVDGGIIGPRPDKRGTTRLYLSGMAAARVATLFHASPLEAIVLNAEIGTASALKMAYAAWTKGSAALLIAVRAPAIAEGIDAHLVAEWQKSIPGLSSRSETTVCNNVRKAWRFVGEMEEIAHTFRSAGLPDGFPLAAREIYRRLVPYKETPAAPSLLDVASVILEDVAAGGERSIES